MGTLEILEPVPGWASRTIADGLAEANAANSISRENFAVVSGAPQRLYGGVTASVSFGVLFINNIWVCPERRGQGLGRILMMAAEAEGKRRSAAAACVDTLSVQAPGFYERLGYAEFGRIAGFANGEPLDRIWLRKALA